MKLFTRLIDSGVFIFWSTDENSTEYNLKIKITVGDDKITLVDINTSMGQNYYTFDRVGSGDYEIELNAFQNNVLSQTETKNIKIISSTQKSEERFATLLDKLTRIAVNTCFGNTLSDIENTLSDIEDTLNAIKCYEKYGEWPDWDD